MEQIKRLVILGAGESGTGSAILARKEGFEVFVSDNAKIKPRYREMLESYQIDYEEGAHTERKILNADEIIKSPGIPESSVILQLIRKKRFALPGAMERLLQPH